MAYGGNPHTSDEDAIRVLVGDTRATAILDSNTYTLFIATEGSLYAQAAMAARALAGYYAREMNKRVGDLWRDAKVQYDHYEGLAIRYEQIAKKRIPARPFAGGTSEADIETREETDDRPEPFFKLGMQDAVDLPTGDSDDDE